MVEETIGGGLALKLKVLFSTRSGLDRIFWFSVNPVVQARLRFNTEVCGPPEGLKASTLNREDCP
jgi:uncharacterized protein YqkB